MTQIATAFWFAGSQIVRLPREFWFEGDELLVERRGSLILLSPIRYPSVEPFQPSESTEQLRRPPPNVTFAGFVGRRPIPARSEAEILAEVRRLFGQAPANDNAPPSETAATD
jgi:virulence-associated protein VagC